MTDNIETPVETSVVAPAPVTEQIVPAVVETPVVGTTPTPETVTVEAPAEEVPVTAETPKTETVLGEALDKSEAKTEEVKAEDTKNSVEGEQPKTEEVKPEGQSEEPASPPVYEAFTLPENFSVDEGRMKEFTDVLSELETTGKVDHALVQQFGQKAVDLFTSELTKAQEKYNKFLQTSWDRQKIEWKDSFLNDPEIGGNRAQTTVDAALSFIRTHGGTPEHQAEFKTLMETSGLGNHPAMIRLFANAARAMAEGQPLAAQKPVSPPKSKVSTLYGKNS